LNRFTKSSENLSKVGVRESWIHFFGLVFFRNDR
jgi:hypothetical protein